MGVTRIITDVSAWVGEAVCSKVRLKLPNPDCEGAAYNAGYEEVVPSVWPLMVPTSGGHPPHARPTVPSVCVELMEGEDRVQDSQGTARLRLAFTAWNPGEHGLDLFDPAPQGAGRMGFARWSGEEAERHFRLNYEGWRDAWNFVDTALREVESRDHIAGYRVMHENGVKYGPFVVDDAMIEDYPYWYAWVSFDLAHQVNRVREDIKDLL